MSLPEGIAVDASGGKIYWADRGAVDKIQRSNLDGTGVEDLVTTGLIGPQGIAVDASGGKIYWTNLGTDKIQRSNLDGTGVEDLVTGLSSPEGIAVYGAGGKIYWTNLGTDKIQRSNLDGTGVEDLVTGVFDPRFIALDVIPPMAISWAGSSSSDWGDANNWSPNLVPRAIDDVTIVSFTFSPILNVNATANNVTINSGSLNLNGKTLTITNDFQQNGGTLVMTNSADQMGVGNNFTLNTGASNTSSLTDGIIRIAGLFTQVGTGTDDFQASSNHTVALSGTGDQTISFGSTGTGSNNHFGHLRINKTSGKVSVISDMVVESNGLIFFTATTMEISADKAITLGGLETTATATITSPNPGVDRFDFTVSGAIDVDGLNFGSAKTNGLHVTDSGSFTKFDNVTFTNAQSGARHMRVEQQGPVNITFNSASFDDTFGLGSGVNLTLEDTNPPFTGDGDVKLHVVNILGAGAGRSYEEEVASASINWGNEVDWINASGGTWNTASNWSTGSVPGASSEVFIVFSGSYTVTQDVSPTIASLTLGASGASAILSLSGQTLAITGDYVQDNGNLSMASSSDVMDVNGNYTVNGSDGITGTLSDGTIRIAGNFAQTGTGANDFHGISNHTTEVDGTSDQGISFVNAINHFGHLKINKASGKVSVTTDMVIESNGLMLDTATTVVIAADKTVTAGGLSSPASVTPTITSTIRVWIDLTLMCLAASTLTA